MFQWFFHGWLGFTVIKSRLFSCACQSHPPPSWQEAVGGASVQGNFNIHAKFNDSTPYIFPAVFSSRLQCSNVFLSVMHSWRLLPPLPCQSSPSLTPTQQSESSLPAVYPEDFASTPCGYPASAIAPQCHHPIEMTDAWWSRNGGYSHSHRDGRRKYKALNQWHTWRWHSFCPPLLFLSYITRPSKKSQDVEFILQNEYAQTFFLDYLATFSCDIYQLAPQQRILCPWTFVLALAVALGTCQRLSKCRDVEVWPIPRHPKRKHPASIYGCFQK